jgi:NADPH:quinone reductase-like Zn-dependent oxidoreductase
MRALVARAIGEPSDVVALEERPIPSPGPGQVRVRVHAAPVNPNDLHIIRGRYGIAPELPAVLGQECVGVTDAGQRVITVGVLGTWQDYVIVDAGRALPVPGHLSDSTAAQLLTNPLTAHLLLSRGLDVQPGEWIVQTAATSTVGRLVVQLAAHLGVRTVNVVRRRSAVKEILNLGGTEVICTEDEDLGERLAAIGPVAKALDCVGGQLGADVSRALAPGGTMVVYGALSTHRQTDADRLTIPLFARSMIYETKTVRGFWLYRWFTTSTPDDILTALARTFELVDSGVMRIPEARPYPLAAYAEALAAAEAPGHEGKPLLVLRD